MTERLDPLALLRPGPLARQGRAALAAGWPLAALYLLAEGLVESPALGRQWLWGWALCWPLRMLILCQVFAGWCRHAAGAPAPFLDFAPAARRGLVAGLLVLVGLAPLLATGIGALLMGKGASLLLGLVLGLCLGLSLLGLAPLWLWPAGLAHRPLGLTEAWRLGDDHAAALALLALPPLLGAALAGACGALAARAGLWPLAALIDSAAALAATAWLADSLGRAFALLAAQGPAP